MWHFVQHLMDISPALLILLAAVAAYFLWFTSISRPLRGPRVWPLVGSLPGLIQNRHRLNHWISENLSASGGTHQTCIFAVPFIARKQGLVTFTSDPKNIEHVMKTRFDNYPKGPHWQAVFHELFGGGIFNSDGEPWLFQRKTAALEFTPKTLRDTMGGRVRQAIRLRLCPMLESARVDGNPIDLQDFLLRLTFDNICGLVMGKDPETCTPGLPANRFASALDRVIELYLQRLIVPEFVWKVMRWFQFGMEADLNRCIGQLDRYLTDVINQRKDELLTQHRNRNPNSNSNPHDDLLSRFMKKKELSYTDPFLRHVALNFLLAGRDTSAIALSWFFYLLIQNPSVEDKILNELCTVLKQTRVDVEKWLTEPLGFEEVDRLVYLKAALSETLRLYPPIPQDGKYVAADDVFPDGTAVRAGSTVVYSMYGAGRMGSTWGDDCMEFRPERWVVDGKFVMHDQYKFVAFNAGPRVCLGRELAYFQMTSVAAAVLLRHRLTLAEGHRVEEKLSLTLVMKYGLKVKVWERELEKTISKNKEAADDELGG